MPTYEFLCGACEEKFERFLPISSKPVQPCPKCGRASKRLISGGAGLIFKGSGFYITDYRSSDYQSKASAEKPGGASSGGEKKESGGASGSDSKTSSGSSSNTASGTSSSSGKAKGNKKTS